MRFFLIFILTLSFQILLSSQDLPKLSNWDYNDPKEYEIGEVKISGIQYSDENAIRVVSGLRTGDKIRIPGEKYSAAIRNIWDQKLFTDIQVHYEKIIGDVIFLEIILEERPRLSRYTYTGIKKTYHEDLNDLLKTFLLRGGIVTEATKVNAITTIRNFFIKKGYLDVEVDAVELHDEKAVNAILLEFHIQRKGRVKVKNIEFTGNDNVTDKRLRNKMENTKWKKRLFASSKFIKEDYRVDKQSIIDYYNTIGFRDARVMSDSIWRGESGELNISINLLEGNQYYFKNITWKGNSIYSDQELDSRLGIEAGDIYNQELLEERLRFSLDGRDVSSLYMDNGYLFFQVEPTEVAIEGDSIDLEMRIFEGPQATIDRVIIKGNDRTHEHVIRRAIRTHPGDKFSRAELIRSQREIINLGYFNPENLDINTPVNANRGTVDIEYTVEERSSDQLELSAGYQPSTTFYRGGLIGTLGITFNNFSLRNVFNSKAWRPLPQGDGQRLSIRAQTNGKYYQSYNFSFTEPWLGGKKPNSFTLAAFYTENAQYFDLSRTFSIKQLSIGLGSRLTWPDDNFLSNTTINLQNIKLNEFGAIFQLPDGTIITNGLFHNFYLQQTFARSTVADPIFPRDGSSFSLTLQLTPPYSFLSGRDYSNIDLQEKFKWIEYHKWKFDAEWYQTLFGKLVLRASAKIGVLWYYNEDVGETPFERFELGAEPLATQYTITGKDQITLRGYETQDLPAVGLGGASIFDKFIIELRYPLSLNPSSTIYGLAFLEGGNAWNTFRDFNPFDVKRSVGVGLRVFLPMFGTLGFDYGLGFDKPEILARPHKWTELGKFTIILGFEPE